jgi:4-amino-4-deoxy-L-arabinose transferase-like glycosyltransferase
LDAQDLALLNFLRTHGDNVKYLAAVNGSTNASKYIIGAKAEILPMGGYTGQTPFPTVKQFTELISTGQLRYVLTSDADSASTIVWTVHHCALVPPTSYGAPDNTRNLQQQRLYDCQAAS